MCVVEIKGIPRLMAACTTVVAEGMDILTDSEKVTASRIKTLDLICKRHRMDCEYCPDYMYCELHNLIRKYGLDDRIYSQVYHQRTADETSACIVRDASKCILCRRCISTCKLQGVEAISALNRAASTVMGAIIPMAETNCIGCGQCVKNCPTGALFIKDETDLLWKAHNEKKTIVFGIMPETARNIGKFFGDEEPVNEIERIVAITKKIDIDAVYDLSGIETLGVRTVSEEINKKQHLTGEAVFVSACPGAIQYYRENDNLVKFKTNEELFYQMVVREYENKKIEKKQLFVVFISPCVANKKKHACDAVLTTTELFQWMLRACISKFTLHQIWNNTKPEKAQVPKDLEELKGQMNLKTILEGLINQPVVMLEGLPHGDKILEKHSVYMVSCCIGGCVKGGGQFRTQDFIK